MHKEYRRTGGQLGFKEWLQREKAKKFLRADGSTASPADTVEAQAVSDLNAAGGLQTQLTSDYIFGIDKNVLIWTGVGIAAIAAFFIIRHKISKK